MWGCKHTAVTTHTYYELVKWGGSELHGILNVITGVKSSEYRVLEKKHNYFSFSNQTPVVYLQYRRLHVHREVAHQHIFTYTITRKI